MAKSKLPSIEEAEKVIAKAKECFAEANMHADKAIEWYIKTGAQLRKARAMFLGDKEFGQARVRVIPYMSAKWCGDLMRIAERFEGEALPPVSISVLKEIARASDTVVEKVVEKAESGETVTVKKARKMVADDRAPEPDPTPAPDTPVPATGGTPEASENRPGTSVPPPADDASEGIPDGEYELFPLTKHELETVIRCLHDNGSKGALAIAKRLDS